MNRIDKPVTFVGPVTNFGATYGKKEYGFLMLQTAGQPLKLEYPSKLEALQARSTIMEGQNTFGIQKNHVLRGVEMALKQAFKEGLNQAVGGP